MRVRGSWKKLKLFVSIPFVFGFTLAAASKDIKPTMDQIFGHMLALRPYLSDDAKFSDSENDSEIRRHLQQIETLVRQAGHEPQLQGTGFIISRRILEDHLAETGRVFKSGNKSYARWMLNSSLSICMSCHTQLPVGEKQKPSLALGTVSSDNFEQAEFMFVSRNFDEALKYYDQILDSFPQKKVSGDQLETALERKVAIFARLRRNPKGGLESLKKTLTNKGLPEYLAKNARAWSDLFTEWQKEPKFDVDKADDRAIRKFATQSLKPALWDKVILSGNPRMITFLKVSGVLYEYMAKHPNSELIPDILFWLSLCDRGLNNNFFFSLADLYLKECVTRYPTNKVADDCYTEYRDNAMAAYSGSRGLDLPEDVQNELERLKQIIEVARKKDK